MNLERLMKENVEKIENVEYCPSERLKDENGNPQVWILRPLTTKEVDVITERHTKREDKVEFNSRGKRRVRKDIEIKSMELADEMVLESLVENAKLQDSWGVMNELDLLKAILSVPGEYTDLREEVQRLAGFDIDATDELIDETKKNSMKKTQNT